MLANILFRSARNFITSNNLPSTKWVDKVLASFYSCKMLNCRKSFDIMSTRIRQSSTFERKTKRKKGEAYDPRAGFYTEFPPVSQLHEELKCLHCKKTIRPQRLQLLCPRCNNILQYDPKYDVYQLYGVKVFQADNNMLKISLKHLRKTTNLNNFQTALNRDLEYVLLWNRFVEVGYCILCNTISRGEYRLNSYGVDLPECYDSLDNDFKDSVKSRQMDISLCDKINHLYQMIAQCKADIDKYKNRTQEGFESLDIKKAIDSLLRIRFLIEANEKPLLKKLWANYYAEMDLRYM